MAKRVSVDKWLFTVTLLLVFIGLVDGIQRLGGDGQRTLRLALRFPVPADGLGRSRHRAWSSS